MSDCLAILLFLALLLFSTGSWAAEAASEPPEFALPLRGTNAVVRLSEQKGTVVVLDFFAHWCVPCVRCSGEVESGVARYYRERKGNPHGVPVEVFAVNVEAARPDKTDAFIRRTGMERVLEDAGGEVFQKYGGTGLPFLVIIDASGGTTGAMPPQVLYRKAGFEGVEKLRELIDAVEAPPSGAKHGETATNSSRGHRAQNAPKPEPEVPARVPGSGTEGPTVAPETRLSDELPGLNKGVLDFAALCASDILLTDTLLEYQRTAQRTFWGFSLASGHIGLDYVPETRLEHQNEVV